MLIVRYLIAVALVLVGLVWIGQGLGFISGSGMSGQPIFAVFGAALVAGGAWLAWRTRQGSVPS
jgi:LPXTG-motif cell wall-anchored protein